MQQDEQNQQEREARESAYRRGWTQATEETSRILFLLVNCSRCYNVVRKGIVTKVNTGMICIFFLKNSRLFSVLV